MKKMCFSLILALIVGMFFCVTGCGNISSGNSGNEAGSNEQNITKVNEDYFMWNQNYIYALSNEGAKQTSLVIPARCEGFNGAIFADIENKVEEVIFESDNDVVLGGVFTCADNLKCIELPAGLTRIESMEFWRCESLESIVIPAEVTVIGSSAFEETTALKSVEFKGQITEICDYAFAGCGSLGEVVLPDTVTTIGVSAFEECVSLTEVVLPKSVSAIAEFAFMNSGLTSVTVPSEVELEVIDLSAFSQADHEVIVYVTEGSWADQYFEEIFAGNCTKEYVKN